MTGTAARRVLDITKYGEEGQNLLENFGKKIVGQKDAISTLVNMYESFLAGFCDPTRPAGNTLFLGPTGTGKTRVVEIMAEHFFGNERACIKIDCGEFQHSHEIAKLIGSPPGYLGHRETHPALTQEALNQYQTEKHKFSIVLFDEIEKASDSLWSLLLGILDKATLTLGDNRKVDFSKTMIIMTSNLGAQQMAEAVEGGMGFIRANPSLARTRTELEEIAKAAMKRKFQPEFINRIENIVVFETLSEEQIREILNIELMRLQSRLTSTAKKFFLFTLTPKAKSKLLEEGYSKTYGVRQLRRAIEKRIQIPLARLASSGQVNDGDGILISEIGERDFEFAVQPELGIHLLRKATQ